MGSENSKVVIVVTIIIIGISGAAFLSMSNSDNPDVTPNSTGITTLKICGNSTDLLYPELAEANFVFLENGSWQVNANFMDDSAGYYEYLEIYDRTFTVTPEEVESINDALYEGLNQTYSSNVTALMLLESSPSIWYDIQITYTDDSWLYITAFQTDQGHIISNHGTGTPNTNLLDGTVLEPLSALDCLVTAIYNLFSNHID
ncbi:MAG: hypothetical protein ACTSWA_04385 [Candidatus Thorarchaeota archaeon]